MPLHQTPIRLESCDLFLTWPIVIGHEIDADSPFYTMDEAGLIDQDFELVIVVEGNVEATAMRTQIRTSFLPDEIQWGFHFRPCVRFAECCSLIGPFAFLSPPLRQTPRSEWSFLFLIDSSCRIVLSDWSFLFLRQVRRWSIRRRLFQIPRNR